MSVLNCSGKLETQDLEENLEVIEVGVGQARIIIVTCDKSLILS